MPKTTKDNPTAAQNPPTYLKPPMTALVFVITQTERGPFIHDGPDAYEEVLQEDCRPIPGVKEEEVKEWLDKRIDITSNNILLLMYGIFFFPVARTCGGHKRQYIFNSLYTLSSSTFSANSLDTFR